MFQPFLIKAQASTTPSAHLRISSVALATGTPTGFSNGNGSPTIGYYSATSSSWVTLVGSNASTTQVSIDQNYIARPSTPSVGAAEYISSGVYILKVNAATGGSASGGTVYGDTYPAGTAVTLTALPTSGYSFQWWDYILGGSTASSTNNPLTVTLNANTTLAPVFALSSGYTVTYVGNGNTSGSAPAVQSAIANATTTISSGGSLAKTGAIFSHWNTSPNNSGTTYNPGDAYATSSANLILYAQYLSGSAPTVTTASTSAIAASSATVSGSIDDVGVENASVRGFVYGTSTNYGATTTESGSFAAGSFSTSLSSLTCATTYHIAAYALNGIGVAYGSDETLSTAACPVSTPSPSPSPENKPITGWLPPVVPAQIPQTPATPAPAVNAAATASDPTSYCAPKLTSYLNESANNDPAQVRILQDFLRTHEHENIDVTGVFDEATREAVVRFQEKYATDVLDFWSIHAGTGRVYLTTRAKINALICADEKPALICPYFDYARRNDTGDTVVRLQTFLRNTNIAPLEINGVFDAPTETAVKKYQELHSDAVLTPWGITAPTGIVLETTRKQMHRDIGCFEKPVRLPNGNIVE